MIGQTCKGLMLGSALTLALAGCAPVSPRIATAGRWPAGPDASYAIAAGSAGDTALIGRCLATAGMNASATPSYHVRISRADTTGATRVIGGDRAALGPAATLPQPPPPPWPARARIEVLAISVSTLASGDEVYRARIERLAPHAGGPSMPPLEQALCDAIMPAPPR